MATQEFYIRGETDTEARGPFNLEQLTSLAESGQVTPATLFYDATTEQWTAIETNAEVRSLLFPEKKKLSVRAKQQLNTLNQEQADAAPITVNDMLAAAEGRTADTKDKRDPILAMARAAAIGRWSAIVALVLAAAGEMLPATEAITSMAVSKILAQPLVILGAIDLLLAVMLVLGVVSVYPLVRFRAALGLGFLGFIFWTQGQALPFLACTAASVGLFGCTVAVSLLPVLIAAVLAVGGFAFVALHLLS
ncbi:DUF4339 domain-containing protein [Opitutus terrae]|uniref:GYF domain-containing protein n=1 Tax=Opitutus terrae (strain DSM 11246 / JCM 15787 / PB90-1) TaxID=452637 RepID=B1ZTW5_OPITP|nr:DUF4339 domain-containing protein [Opitutus terrae]ACB75847.1 hypothetical protein Oter_2565 [Opitutus terrae PB90-1]